MVIQVPPSLNVSKVGDVLLNNTNLSPDLISGIGTIITILKAIGIIFLIYLVFLIIRSILSIIEKRRIKEIHAKVFEIDKKLDKLMSKRRKK